MSDANPSFFARFGLAFGAFWKVLFDGPFAGRVNALTAGSGDGAASASPSSAPPPVVLREASPDAALQVLGLLQREGRFVDFVFEDVSKFSDAEIGAAARVVHQGAKKALSEHFTIAPVRTEAEGARVTLPAGFDAKSVKLTGNVTGTAPFTGTLTHRGWRVAKVNLPQLTGSHDASVIAPAEVEI